MQEYSRFIGLDVHKESITVAYADAGRQEPVDYGSIPNTPEAVLKMARKLASGGRVRFCYEAGPCGYGLYRQFKAMGHDCMVAAPSLILRKPGCRIKTDRRDARSLARQDRSGDLTAVWVPDETQEAIRDLVRCRKDFKDQQRMMRQRLGALLLRYGRIFSGKAWSKRHALWLAQQKFQHPAQEIVFREYLYQLEHATERIDELGRQMEKCLQSWSMRTVVESLMALKGVALLTAMTIVAELGDMTRFASPRQLMAYLGIVPSEHTSSTRRRLGEITKAGNSFVRRALVESSWSYRKPARITKHLRAKSVAAPQVAKDIAWKAQKRLHDRYWHLVNRGKLPVQAVMAVARELSGFVWAIACATMGRPVTIRQDKDASHGDGIVCGHKGPPPVAEAAPGQALPPAASRPRQRMREFLAAGRS